MTLLFTPFGTMVLFPSVFKNLPYDAFNDFAPVTQVVTYDFGLAAGPMVAARTPTPRPRRSRSRRRRRSPKRPTRPRNLPKSLPMPAKNY